MNSNDPDIGARVDAVLKLAADDAACKLLGVDGILESQLDLTFVDDPLDWLAYDFAAAARVADADEADEEGPTLATLVAEARLVQLVSGSIDRAELLVKIGEYIEEGA